MYEREVRLFNIVLDWVASVATSLGEKLMKEPLRDGIFDGEWRNCISLAVGISFGAKGLWSHEIKLYRYENSKQSFGNWP